jgi:FAD/FMN-containing dehydrogenase
MTLQKRLAAIVGEPNVLAAAADTKPYFTDWRRQYSAAAECVVRPGSTREVAEVVALCAQEKVAIVPQGGNTGLVGGSVPTGTRREIVVAMGRMHRIRALDVLNDTMTVEAGCVLANIQRAAAEAGRLFPLSLAAEGSCQIGGNLSTNAGGVNVLRYGNARDQVLGLEVVLPDGRVWDGLRGLRKDNTGYDLKQLFLGAEGTLGIITAAVLRLYPRPNASATAWIATGSAREAVELLAALRGRVGERISAFELVSRTCLDAVLAHLPDARDPLPARHPWYVLAEFGDSGEQSELDDRLAYVLGEYEAVLAQSGEQSRALWRIRESIPEAQFANVKHDISVPISRIPDFIAHADSALRSAFGEIPIYCFGHVGDGNLHYNVGSKELLARRDDINRVVYEGVTRLGGSISAEHGLGQLKRDAIRELKSPLEMELMRSLKRALDPLGMMNPGKVL